MIYERVKNCSIEEISREEGLGWSEVELIFNHCAKELEKEEWEAPEGCIPLRNEHKYSEGRSD
jgi:hypothetical protein